MADSILSISYINIRGQTGLNIDKQFQIEDFIKVNNCDIIHLQEVNIESDTFSECSYIESNFSLITNNAENKYGTASLVKSDLLVENILCDTAGRCLVFEVAGVTFANVYLPSGTDATARNNRENYLAEIIPQILVNRKVSGCAGGDFNCIDKKQDATKNPETKISPSLVRLVKAFDWADSFRYIHPTATTFSRYYETRGTSGASRIDRQYHWGNITPVQAQYLPLAFSDHFAHIVKVKMPDQLARLCSPRNRPQFKVREEVARDQEFQERVQVAMEEWDQVRQEGLPVLAWWEMIVKPGIKKIAMERSKQINVTRKSQLNILLLRQAYLVKKIHNSQANHWDNHLPELLSIQLQIQSWYRKLAEKIQLQSKVDEFQEAEQTRIYHHEIHKKHLKKSSILKLMTSSGLIEGHDLCAQHLESLVADLLLKPAELDENAQQTLLAEMEPVVTEADNSMLAALPDKEEVFNTLKAANLKAAPGTDGIPSLVYKLCWNCMGDALTAVAQAKHGGEKLPASMRTALMVFGTKPKKANSLKPGDKRRISLLNSDFKMIEDLDARRFRKISSKCLSSVQYVGGKDRRIHHGIARARDAINAVSQSRIGCGIADTDFVAAFDWLVLSWVWKVLLKLGEDCSVVRRVQGLYEDSITITVVNSKLGRAFPDKRGSLRQGGCASMDWFSFGIDPLLRYLEKRLQGILISSLPVSGPSIQGEATPMPPLEERFKLMAYCDDVKPSITTMAEFLTVDHACSLFEKSSGCLLHRDPAAGKCKFLPLGRWKGTLQQEDIPVRYMVLSDSLEMVGVELKASWLQTRKANGDIIQSRVSNTINAWKSGKFMDLSSRPWSLNTYALTKVWFKCHTVDLRVSDTTTITSKVKSWLFQDQLEKPEEMILFRPIQSGGLGLHSVKYKALASLIRTFMETAANPSFKQNHYHTLLYRTYVLEDDSITRPPPMPPYYSAAFFSSIKWVKENTPLNVISINTAQWYRVLLEKEVTMVEMNDNSMEYTKSRAELASPGTDWVTSWRRARMKGLGSEAISFLWKLLHRLLPTEQRLARILPNSAQTCKYCPTPVTADLVHCFFSCVKTGDVGGRLLTAVRQHEPAVTQAGLLRLEFQEEGDKELPLVWITAHTLLYMWTTRASGRVVDLYLTRSMLEFKINLLRETRYASAVNLINEILENIL